MPTSATGSKSANGFEPFKRSAEHGFTPSKRSAEHGFTPSKRSAEHGFTPSLGSAEHGFTLIELMVVVTIIGLASAAVVLLMPDPRGRLRDEAEKFGARTLAARDDAIITSRDMSVWVTRDGYGVERRRRGQWQPVVERPFEPERWTRGTTALVGPSGRIRAVFDTTGAVSAPVTVTLVRDSARATVTISGNGDISVAG